MYFQQLFDPETSTYTYLLADEKSKEAILIDPVLDQVERDYKLLQELNFHLKFVLDTHIHADHVTGAGELRRRTGAKTAVSYFSQVDCADLLLRDGDELEFGQHKIKVISTPGHTDSCMSYYCEGRVFTGDSLMIRSAGRTDFQQGSSEKLYESIQKKLYQLPDETLVYPAHDYRGMTVSSIANEKKFNARIPESQSLQEFQKIMSELNLSQPKKIHMAVPANLKCGLLNL